MTVIWKMLQKLNETASVTQSVMWSVTLIPSVNVNVMNVMSRMRKRKIGYVNFVKKLTVA